MRFPRRAALAAAGGWLAAKSQPARARDAAADSGPARAAAAAGSVDLGRIAEVRKCYKHGYAFPLWVSDGHPGLEQCDWERVEVYHPADASPEEVRRVITEREPVNIAMRRLYDSDCMEAAFGWRVSRYSSYWEEKGQLAPSVAIYCRTPLALQPDDSVGEVVGGNSISGDAHIISVVAPAFDAAAQPDMLHFFPNGPGSLIAESRIEELRASYRTLFSYIFECAERQRLERVALSLFGTGAFSAHFRASQGGVFELAWLPALQDTLAAYSGRFASVKEVSCFGLPADRPILDRVVAAVKAVGRSAQIYGSFPKEIPLDGTLLVNAWDPHSLAGNGNHRDMSLDGFVGRHTAVSMLCWPAVNGKVRYVPVEPVPPPAAPAEKPAAASSYCSIQ